LGHIGGDNFFVGMQDMGIDDAAVRIRRLIEMFRSDFESFYDAEARKRGYLAGSDREGKEHRYPLMTTSAALVEVKGVRISRSADDFAGFIAEQKRKAKASPDHLCVIDLY
jgi:hypothetical protein